MTKVYPKTKTCNKCKQNKPLSEFPKDGRNSCVLCERERAKRYNKTKPGRTRKERYNESPKAKKRQKKYDALRRKERPHELKAYGKLKAAIERGDIPHISTQTCQRCGAQAQNYHHSNYDKPLKVIALCISCHRAVHNEETK